MLESRWRRIAATQNSPSCENVALRRRHVTLTRACLVNINLPAFFRRGYNHNRPLTLHSRSSLEHAGLLKLAKLQKDLACLESAAQSRRASGQASAGKGKKGATQEPEFEAHGGVTFWSFSSCHRLMPRQGRGHEESSALQKGSIYLIADFNSSFAVSIYS